LHFVSSVLPPSQAAIYARVSSRVLAPCCWSQPIQIHQSEAAEKVRAEVIADIRQGDDEKQILDRLAAEYGERILGEPRGARGTIAYVTPFVVLIAGLILVTFMVFRLAGRRPRLSNYTGPLPDLQEVDL
jgi:cytochrome c-type biogenesis protein CcmH/NrfF